MLTLIVAVCLGPAVVAAAGDWLTRQRLTLTPRAHAAAALVAVLVGVTIR